MLLLLNEDNVRHYNYCSKRDGETKEHDGSIAKLTKLPLVSEPIIKCHQLVLGYRKQALARPFNLSIRENQWIGVIGENGSGKSTFFKSILGLQPTLSGDLRIFNRAPGIYNQWISYIPQERVFNLGERTSGRTIVKAAYQANRFGLPLRGISLNKKLDVLFAMVGVSTYANQPFQTLSGGQKKRLYLAQALINNPKLLLLDEPLADLDPQAKKDFIHALKKIHRQQQITLLIISHDMHEIAHQLDNFIHFKEKNVHLCKKLPCLLEDKSVIL